MRWLLILILILLAAWYFMPQPDPVPAEESFIGDQVRTLRKAEGFEQEYLDSVEEHKRRLEKQLEEPEGSDGG